MDSTRLYILFFLLLVAPVCIAGNSDKVFCINNYFNITTSPSFIAVSLLKENEKEAINVVLENEMFARFLAYQNKKILYLPDDQVNTEEFHDYAFKEYVSAVTAEKNYSYSEFKVFLEKEYFKNETITKSFLEIAFVDDGKINSQYVDSGLHEILNKYFTKSGDEAYYLRSEFSHLQNDMTFVYLLLKNNLYVGIQDVAPIFFVNKCAASSE